LASRYLDIFQIGIAVSVVSALSLMPAHLRLTSLRRGVPAAVAAWFLLLAFWVGHDAYFHLKRPVEVRRQTAVTETNNLRGYLSTGDFSYLANKPIFDIPYPSAERLRGLLDDPALRSVLPPGLTSDGAHDGVIESVKVALLQLPYFFVGLGLLLFLAAVRLLRAEGTRADGLRRDQRALPHAASGERNQSSRADADRCGTLQGSSETGSGEVRAN
jgi:hypothetical protein